jgi:hypothetical protein
MYQDETRQKDCKTCPPGFVCDPSNAPVVLYENAECPSGKLEKVSGLRLFYRGIGTFLGCEGVLTPSRPNSSRTEGFF